MGYAANPLVNFNVEHLTSRAMVGGSSWQLKAFAPPIPGGVTSLRAAHGGMIADGPFHRHVYHPHGALDVYGLCVPVLTATDYAAMRGTLALELAVHAAFRSPLLIVGMSLDDRYLREQLANFRPFIDGIFWLQVGAPNAEDAAWAYRNDISIIPLESWAEFWSRVDRLPGPDETTVAETWMSVVTNADIALEPDQTLNSFREMGWEPSLDWKQLHALRGRDDAPSARGSLMNAKGAILKYLARVDTRAGDQRPPILIGTRGNRS